MVTESLQRFCNASGLKVNLTKSRMMASKGVPRSRKNSLTQITNITFTNDLGKYLGFQMMHGRVTTRHFGEVMTKVQGRLAAWKGRLFRRFIWSGEGARKLHLVKWETLTRPRKEGGLGVCIARNKNISLLGKLIWDLVHHTDKLWVRVVMAKYRDRNVASLLQRPGSYVLTSLRRAFEELRPGFRFQLGDGEASFWFENWAHEGPLANEVPFVHLHDLTLRVRDVWQDGRWHLEQLHSWLSTELQARIFSMQIWLHPSASDGFVWEASTNGEYLARTGYRWLCDRDVVLSGGWQWIWRLPLSESIRFFLWQVCHDALPTGALLVQRHVTPDGLCLRCRNEVESIAHVLFRCEQAVRLWRLLHLEEAICWWSGSWPKWLQLCFQRCHILPLIACWVLWKMRNERVFNGGDSSVWEALRRVHALHTTMVRAFAVADDHTSHDAGLTWVSCIFAEGLQTSLHVDASFNTASGQAGVGGLARDSNGRWLWGFFGAVEAVDALQVELLASLCYAFRTQL
uniref:Ribonuclease H protein At1g65750 n=1 Tax=Cajanus cajan TaxID=3821 RepID=A0A151UAE8_CAJCA|nr:Putative ribonuclease H protein At1g65750 [Cajanus cajan]